MSEVLMLPHYSEDNTAYFDVDDTLVFLEPGKDPLTVAELVPHLKHIQSIKNHWIRGHHVIVWSKGGKKWAQYVVDAFKLGQFVHEVKSKGKWYYDDQELDTLGDRIYYPKGDTNAGQD